MTSSRRISGDGAVRLHALSHSSPSLRSDNDGVLANKTRTCRTGSRLPPPRPADRAAQQGGAQLAPACAPCVLAGASAARLPPAFSRNRAETARPGANAWAMQSRVFGTSVGRSPLLRSSTPLCRLAPTPPALRQCLPYVPSPPHSRMLLLLLWEQFGKLQPVPLTRFRELPWVCRPCPEREWGSNSPASLFGCTGLRSRWNCRCHWHHHLHRGGRQHQGDW